MNKAVLKNIAIIAVVSFITLALAFRITGARKLVTNSAT